MQRFVIIEGFKSYKEQVATEPFSPKHNCVGPSTFYPSPSQLSYADSLGIEPIEWESGITSRDFSRMIDDKKVIYANFQDQYKQKPTTGIMKEVLRQNDDSFDEETLTRPDGMRLYIQETKGARHEDIRLLRHIFKMPIEMMMGLTRLQAVTLLDQLKKSSEEGLLTDVPPRTMNNTEGFARSSSTYNSSMDPPSAKRKLHPS